MRNLYSIKDQLVGFGLPFMAPNDADAARTFQYALENTPELYFKADDLELFLIGFLNEDTGAIIPANELRLIFRGSSFIRRMAPEEVKSDEL